MKNIFCFLLFVSVNSLSAQFTDNFSDGDFVFNPIWEGDEDSFEVLNNTLHLNAPVNTSESYLATYSNAAMDGYWEFALRLDFNPSNSNKILVYIVCDSANLKGPLNGYYLQIGGANDQIDLYKQTGLIKTLLIEGTPNLLDLSQVDIKVKISRDNQGVFQLFVDTSQNLSNYLFQGQAADLSYTNTNYFGFLCDYTSTRSDKFWIDDIVVTAQSYIDTDPPQLLAYQINSLDEISLYFNEALDSVWTNLLLNYSISSNTIYSLNLINSEIQIKLQKELLNNIPYNFQMTIQDENGNHLDTSINLLIKDNFGFESLLINEVYPDESPSFGMPNAEFVEIFNPSLDTIILENWKIADAKDTATIPSDTIFPNEHLILCKTSSQIAYASFGKTIAVPSFPSLNNSDDQMILLNAYDKVVDSVFYGNSWYRELMDSLGNEKKSGGYSLERVALHSSCGNYYNWHPSFHPLGASPGQENSVLGFTFPSTNIQVLDLLIEDDTTLLFTFNEELPNIMLQNCEITFAGIEQVYQPTKKELYILLEDAIKPGKIYQLEISDAEDCYNSLVPSFTYDFYINEPATPRDVIFNEILFNPRVGGSDYIELYNTSEKAIDLEGFTLLEYDVFNPTEVVDSHVLKSIVVPPNEYIVLSEDTSHVISTYTVQNPKNLINQEIPNLDDDESILTLYLPNKMLSDSMYYHKSWHLELLDVYDGVALERISPEANTTASNNWYSAAKTYGYGTPTAINSQHYQVENNEDILISPEVFTPNDDGYKDFCTIQYLNKGSGNLINISIHDIQGKEVKLIAQNHSVGAQNAWRWNGLNNNFEKADIGIYVVLFEVFNLKGQRKRYKEKVVLGTQLN